MTRPVQRDPQYAELMAALADFHSEHLEGRVGLRELAKAAGVGRQTVSNWLGQRTIPAEADRLLMMVQVIGEEAKDAGVGDGAEAAALFDKRVWRRAHTAEVQRHTEGTTQAGQAARARRILERMLPGTLLSEVNEPRTLEVHQAIESPVSGLPGLTAYVSREHDRQLAKAVTEAAAGKSRIAVLVGGSSTGKTRACWEALNLLREQSEPWRLWHPMTPKALLAGGDDIAPRTVIWLNEAQRYLEHSEEAAAALRDLLRDPGRGPVLGLATLWPDHWDTLVTRAAPDRHPHARELLDGHKIHVPDAFTETDLAVLATHTERDPRLEEAAAQARDGHITQYLAGVPALMDRYESAPPATKALIHAAMDARRLGAGPRIPLAWLADAAPGYLTADQWRGSSKDWLEQAFSYVEKPCKGIPGILTLDKPDAPRNQRRRSKPARSSAEAPDRSGREKLFVLADYLEQHGRRDRADTVPPIDFWTAAAHHACHADLAALGDAASKRGLAMDGAQLYKKAARQGSLDAACSLLRILHDVEPEDLRPIQWISSRIALDDPAMVRTLLESLQNAQAYSQMTALAERVATEAVLTNPASLAGILDVLREAKAHPQIVALLDRNPAAAVDLDDPAGLAGLLSSLFSIQYTAGGADTGQQITVLAERAADEVVLDDPTAVAKLLSSLSHRETHAYARDLAARAAAEATLTTPSAVVELMSSMRWSQAYAQIKVLAERAIDRVALDDPAAAVELMDTLSWERAYPQSTALGEWVAARAPLDAPDTVAKLLHNFRKAGAHPQMTALLDRNPAGQVSLKDPAAVALLLERLREAEAHSQIATLLDRLSAGDIDFNDGWAVGRLLESLQEAGAHPQMAALAERAAAAVPLHKPYMAASLLSALTRIGARRQFTAVAHNAVAQAALDDAAAVDGLLNTLRWAEAPTQAQALMERAAARCPVNDPRVVGKLLWEMAWTGHEPSYWLITAVLDRDPANQVDLEDPGAVAELLSAMRRVDAFPQITALLDRNPASHVALENPAAVAKLLDTLWYVKAYAQVTALLDRDPSAEADCEDPYAVAKLLDSLGKTEAHRQMADLAERAATAVPLDDACAVSVLLDSLREAEAHPQIIALLDRDPASQVALDNAWHVARLLRSLRHAEPHHPQNIALAEQVAARVTVQNPSAVAAVLDALREARASPQLIALTERLPAAEAFDLFTEHREGYRFGREPDGSAASPWSWENLE
ncbi:hypothetical protein ACIGXF_25805 [Streptomyces sp. NPDC053086]|uniref:hypothetical protein n=1 Tax=unclassified Streptomyces TaxID=2593676 RepID=UPI0037CF5455